MKQASVFISLFIFVLILNVIAFAGNVDRPTDTPEPTMYTLEDIYNLINNDSVDSHTLSPTVDIGESMYTISDLYIKLANLIQAEDIASTTVTYLGVTGGEETPEPIATTTKEFDPTSEAGTAFGYTLEDIYDLIINNNRIIEPSGEYAPSSEPADSMHTLTEIYEALVDLIDPANINEGVVYLGVEGTYSVPPPTLESLIIGLIGYWPLDEDTNDYSDSGNDGVSFDATTTPSGAVGGAYSFDGISSYISMPDNNLPVGSSPRSFSVWVNPKSLDSRRAIFNYGPTSWSNGILGNIYIDKLEIGIAGHGVNYGTPFSTDSWQHVAYTFDGDIWRAYYNGTEQEVSESTGMETDTTLNGSFIIGKEGTSNYPFDGDIDEMAIWNRTLSDVEIEFLYNEGSGLSLIE